MSLAEARALCADLRYAEHRPDEDRKSLEALARWMIRFSPVVSIEPPDAILLDVTGSERLFRGLDRLVRLISAAVAKMNLDHGIALAPTVGAAWALASFGGDNLQQLPLAGLRLDDEKVRIFQSLGIETIGQLMNLPRATLTARFGPEVLMRLDQALGRIAEPLNPILQSERIFAQMGFESPIDSLEMIWEIFKRLIVGILPELRRRGCGARKLIIEFFSTDASPIQKSISLSRPSCDAAGLFKLLKCAAEKIGGESGFVGFRLSVAVFERLGHEQLHLLRQEAQIAGREMDQLIERLGARLGDEALLFPQLIESHLPEKSFRLGRQLAGRTGFEGSKIRPLQLLPQPIEIRCIASPSGELEGLPISFGLDRAIFQISYCSGPERIGGTWWEGRNKTRDYFDVEDSSGQRFWVFRVSETRRWVLRGFFC